MTQITIAELRDNDMHDIVTTLSVEAVMNTADSPSGGNAVVRGEAGAKGTTPMTMSELRDSATHDVESGLEKAEAEKKKIAGNANHRAQELKQDIQTTAEPGPPTVKDLRAVEMKADSGTDNGRPSAEVGCGLLHQTSAAATRGSKATLQLATTPKQETIMREKEASLSNEDIKNDAHQREERATEETERAAMRDDSRTAQLKMCESSDSNETKRVRSDMGTRAVQELHGQHPSLSD